MILARPITDIEILKNIIEYNPETGIFTWAKDRKGHSRKGNVAGGCHGSGYTTIRINGKDYLAHRLAWAIHYGSIPENMQIDHINGDRKDNRILNLRLATHEENCRNSRPRKHNKSGIKGVRRMRSKWAARIRINNEEIWLGSYETSEAAAQAYKEAADKFHKAFAKK
jgi:hypothetical protein